MNVATLARIAGTLLRRTPLNDEIAELEARYQVINASGHSFTAIIQGKSHISTGHATLNGVVTEGDREKRRPCPARHSRRCVWGSISRHY